MEIPTAQSGQIKATSTDFGIFVIEILTVTKEERSSLLMVLGVSVIMAVQVTSLWTGSKLGPGQCVQEHIPNDSLPSSRLHISQVNCSPSSSLLKF